MTVAAVVPAYNEEGYVGSVIESIPPLVDRVYVIDDGSTDDTWSEIETHAATRNGRHDGRFEDLVVPIRHESNRGVGGAIKTGYLRAREEGIDATVVLGGDGQMDPTVLTHYLDPIAEGVAGYAKGNRFVRPDDWADMPRFRLVGNVLLSYLTKIASGYWGVMDSQNGYTAISRDTLERTDIEGMYEYYGYCNDLLVRLNLADVRVADVPRSSDYAYSDGWKSHIEYTEYVPRVSLMLLRGFLRRLGRKYLLSDYSPVAPLYLLGTTVLGAGVTGLVAALTGRTRDGVATWLLATVAGVLGVLYASMLDMVDNEHLSVVVPPGESDETAYGDGDGESREPTPQANSRSTADGTTDGLTMEGP